MYIIPHLIARVINFLNLLVVSYYYENMPMQYITIFHSCKNDKFQMKNCDVSSIFFAQNIDCGHTLEPPQCGGGSNEYPQSMFRSKTKKKMKTFVNPSITI